MKKELICDICDSKTEKGIQVNDSIICKSCIMNIAKEMSENDKKKVDDKAMLDITPKKLIEELDNHIIGQEKAKEILSIAVYNHMLRINHNEKCKEENNLDDIIEKSNILLFGPTGVGKTATIKILARLIDVPFTIADATGLTEAGYAGKDVDTILTSLIDNAGGDIEKAEKGIVFIDEFDKLSRKSGHIRSTRDIGGESVQQSLLKMIEGTDYNIDRPVNGFNLISRESSTVINTDDILFILGGAFEGIYPDEEINNKKIGFSVITPDNKEEITKEKKDITVEDFRKYGIIPEILGRAPIICKFEELNINQLKRILTEPKNSIIGQSKRLVELSKCELEVEDSAITEIAKIAEKRKTGARSLKGVVEDVMKNVYIELPSDDISKIVLDKDSIINKKPKILRKKKKVEIG